MCLIPRQVATPAFNAEEARLEIQNARTEAAESAASALREQLAEANQARASLVTYPCSKKSAWFLAACETVVH